jgi:hypothetical protein
MTLCQPWMLQSDPSCRLPGEVYLGLDFHHLNLTRRHSNHLASAGSGDIEAGPDGPLPSGDDGGRGGCSVSTAFRRTSHSTGGARAAPP